MEIAIVKQLTYERFVCEKDAAEFKIIHPFCRGNDFGHYQGLKARTGQLQPRHGSKPPFFVYSDSCVENAWKKELNTF